MTGGCGDLVDYSCGTGGASDWTGYTDIVEDSIASTADCACDVGATILKGTTSTMGEIGGTWSTGIDQTGSSIVARRTARNFTIALIVLKAACCMNLTVFTIA